VQVCIVCENSAAEELFHAAMARFMVNKSVIRLRDEQMQRLPPALAETLPHAPSSGSSFVLVCRGNACLPPIMTTEDLEAALL
jgi:hypothetical protein